MELLKYHFDLFDSLFESKYNNKMTADLEKLILEVKHNLKNTLDEEAPNYTHYCLQLDKHFDDYVDSKRG